tara:strand:+ start:26387 stop:26731 length:345 start_codon:yes stop_codon:yes gene_type:complete
MDSLPRPRSKPGPLIEYISELKQAGLKKQADIVVGAVRSSLNSKDGAILLELLEKSILERSIDISADPRALDANNAQSFIALDLRRILSNEFDATVEPTPTNASPRRRSGSRNL